MSEEQRPPAFRPDAEGLKQVLGDLEADILESVWAADERRPGSEVSVRDVMEALVGRRALAYATVKTVMNRLVEKGQLARRKEDRSFVYRAPVSREEFWRRVRSGVLRGLIGGPYGELSLSHLVDAASAEDERNLDRLAALIEEKRRRLRERPGSGSDPDE